MRLLTAREVEGVNKGQKVYCLMYYRVYCIMFYRVYCLMFYRVYWLM
jgi:hypothetical protein